MRTRLQQGDDFSVGIPFPNGITVDEATGAVGVDWHLQEYGLLADFPEDYNILVEARPTQQSGDFTPMQWSGSITVEGFYPDTAVFEFGDIIPEGSTWPVEFYVEGEQIIDTGPNRIRTRDEVADVTYDPEGTISPPTNPSRTALLVAGGAIVAGAFIATRGNG